MNKTSKIAVDYKTSVSKSNKTKNPLLKRLYHDRSVIMHKLVSIVNNLYSSYQLLILGSGLDDSYNAYSAQTYCVDITHSQSESNGAQSGAKYIQCDLRQSDILFERLSAASFDCNMCTIVLIEVVLCYINESDMKNLIKSLYSHLPTVVIIMLDPLLFSPTPLSASGSNSQYTDGFTQQFTDEFVRKGEAYTRSYTNLPQYKTFLQACGFKYTTVKYLSEAINEWLSVEERRYPLQSEPFDEFSSLALLRHRYIVTLACSHSNMLELILENLTSASLLYGKLPCPVPTRLSDLVRRIEGIEERVVKLEGSYTTPHATPYATLLTAIKGLRPCCQSVDGVYTVYELDLSTAPPSTTAAAGSDLKQPKLPLDVVEQIIALISEVTTLLYVMLFIYIYAYIYLYNTAPLTHTSHIYPYICPLSEGYGDPDPVQPQCDEVLR